MGLKPFFRTSGDFRRYETIWAVAGTSARTGRPIAIVCSRRYETRAPNLLSVTVTGEGERF
jgi:hypothetical protein